VLCSVALAESSKGTTKRPTKAHYTKDYAYVVSSKNQGLNNSSGALDRGNIYIWPGITKHCCSGFNESTLTICRQATHMKMSDLVTRASASPRRYGVCFIKRFWYGFVPAHSHLLGFYAKTGDSLGFRYPDAPCIYQKFWREMYPG
jgi:hypothetical protein